jgi:hypothetical protein
MEQPADRFLTVGNVTRTPRLMFAWAGRFPKLQP